jgi:5,10-methylenetetrahydromethanopterin reductase
MRGMTGLAHYPGTTSVDRSARRRKDMTVHIGVTLTPRPGADALARLREDLSRAASDGFASAWMAHVFRLDALTALAVAGSGLTGIEIGTAVIPTYPRHPAALAQQALTTNLALDGRLTLGIGVSHQVVIEGMYGYSFQSPATHMSEYLSVLLPLLDGQDADFQGSTVRAKIGLSVARPGRTPVLLAALGPRMLRLAAERTDGTILWMTGPATVRDYVTPTLAEAAATAGRGQPRIVCQLPVCVTDDPDGAKASAARTFAMYGELPSYRAMLDREGAAGPADVALVGPEDSVAGQIRALADSGVTDFAAAEFGAPPERERTRQLLVSLLR